MTISKNLTTRLYLFLSVVGSHSDAQSSEEGL